MRLEQQDVADAACGESALEYPDDDPVQPLGEDEAPDLIAEAGSESVPEEPPPPPLPIRVLLVDDHVMVRDGLGALLRGDPSVELIGVAGDGDEAVRMSEELEPDVVVLDVCMPGMNGIEAAARIRALSAGVRVIALSAHGDQSFVQQMAAAGATGFVQKDQSVEDLLDAIRQVKLGEAFFSRAPEPAEEAGFNRLSARERALLEAMARNSALRNIAEDMGISTKTVDTYRRRIMKKLGFTTPDELLRYVTALGVGVGVGARAHRSETGV
ncbi:response regulator transcription factor [Thiorhodovibrio frisius]|uniref:Response regulator containing a CheY-like receiver domain and an HTH DNA-binding domain n=1 Tax=Thiorhodovibrio frisius TaxID=631362 RepID=H8YYJ1_9GAMM|nr:response regulator transcription factor [Thiorhodovibrio frisius]EIC23517.1 response regulator containing a CheY-like receiver domain and an HTH DNA-binding domain [Thiorhodovibrio frisius]WPL23396.1 Transcriptional regulatory protein LiaR [Thiorhodovibrio frisius]